MNKFALFGLLFIFFVLNGCVSQNNSNPGLVNGVIDCGETNGIKLDQQNPNGKGCYDGNPYCSACFKEAFLACNPAKIKVVIQDIPAEYSSTGKRSYLAAELAIQQMKDGNCYMVQKEWIREVYLEFNCEIPVSMLKDFANGGSSRPKAFLDYCKRQK